MNCRLICFCIVAAAIASSTLCAADEFPFKKEELHTLIREVAAKIEEKYKGVHPEADGLVQRVEETLASPEPPKPDEEDRGQMLAKKMTLMNSEAAFKCTIGGVRGAVFDNSDIGHMQRYHDLEAANASDAEEVLRWLERKDAAQHLKWKDKEEICSQRALGAARAWVSREPKNAMAHLLLGQALEWSSEKLTALQTALKLDPKQPLAIYKLLDRRTDQALEEAALRREVGLEEKTTGLARALFDRPLSEEETLTFERKQEKLRREAGLLLKLAQERSDLTAYLNTVKLLSAFKLQHIQVAMASKRMPEEVFEVFMARLLIMTVNSLFTLFDDDDLLRTSLELADGDPESTGAIMLVALAGDAMHAQLEKQRPKEPRMEMIRQTFAKLIVMTTADDSLRAARAAEAAFIMEFGMMMAMNREPTQLDLLLRAIHLDPFRQRTQQMVMGVCRGMFSKADDSSAAAALTLTELALLPNLETRRTCSAASASLLHDWPAAHRHIDDCLKEKPNDLGLLNQKAVTFLRESQSKAAQKKAEIYFHKIESLREKESTDQGKADLKLIARNHILFLMMGGKNDAAREELAAVKQNKVLDEKECKELEALLP